MTLRRALLALSLVLAACTDAGPAVRRGDLTVTLISPNGDEGAAVLLLLGEGVVDTRRVGETEVYSELADGAMRVVLVHPAGGTLSFELGLTNWRRRPVAVVSQVAAPDDQLRDDLSAYRVSFTR